MSLFRQLIGNDESGSNSETLSNLTNYSKLSNAITDNKINTKQIFRFGVNLEGLEFGTVFPGVAGTHYFTVQNSDVDTHYDNGARIFRIPFHWERLQLTLGGDLDQTYLGYLKSATDYILSKDKDNQIIWDCHNYSKYKVGSTEYQIGTPQVTQDHYIDLWTKLGKVASYNPNIILCLMNEPINSDPVAWAGITQALVLALRNENIANILQVSGIQYASASAFIGNRSALAFDKFYDPLNNTMFELHSYHDPDRDGSTFGNTSLNAQYPHHGTSSLALVTQWCRKKGFKLFLGETATPEDQLSYTNLWNLVDFMNQNKDVFYGVTIWGGTQYWGSTYPFALVFKPALQTQFKNNANYERTIHDPSVAYSFDFENNLYEGVYELSDVFSHTRSTRAFGAKKNGKLVLFQADKPRITDNGLLLETATTNLVNTINPTINTLTNVTLKRNYPAVDGSLNGFRLTDNTTNAPHWARTNVALTPTQKYTVSIYFKNVNYPNNFFVFGQLPTTHSIYRPDSPVAHIGANEWTRQFLTFTNVYDQFVPSYMAFGFQPNSFFALGHQPDSYIGVGSSIDYCFPQVENKNYPTSPTVGATRSADVMSITGELLTTLQSDFTIVMRIHKLPVLYTGTDIFKIFTLRDSVGAEIINLTKSTDHQITTTLYTTATFNTGLPTDISTSNRAQGTFFGQMIGLSFSRSTGRVSVTMQGSVGAEVTGLTTIPTVASAFLEPLEGYIQYMAVYNTAKTLTELNAIIQNTLTLPVAPVLATPTATSTTLALIWTMTLDTGVTDYIVEYKASSSSTWIVFPESTSTTKTATITGLTTLTSYNTRVKAVNEFGTGAYSNIQTISTI